MILLDRARRRALRETTAWLLGRRTRIRVVGDSMLPTLEAGNFVLVDRDKTPAAGQLAVAHHPDRAGTDVIKRVGSVLDDGTFYLVSDNVAAGTDSRTWGPVAGSAIVGTVTLLLDRPATDLGSA